MTLQQEIKQSSGLKKTIKIAIEGADVLTPSGWEKSTTVLIEDGRFVSIKRIGNTNGYQQIKAHGLRMFPGIVDLDGDAFERMICPRPGVNIPLPIAMVENDRNLLAAGITTYFCGITDSYEPGLRSRETARNLINFIWEEGQYLLRCNHLIHIRHELTNTKGHEELCRWLELRRIHFLSINDHLPPLEDRYKWRRHISSLRQRVTLSNQEIVEMLTELQEHRQEGSLQVEQLVELAHIYGIPVASRDDDSEEKVALSQRRRIAISLRHGFANAEFPANVDLAAKERKYGAAVLMGAPNLIQGGSDIGWMSVVEAVKNEVLDCLCSDYHYPSLFHAPFKLHSSGLMSLEQAWELVSSRPATAIGLGKQKGKIAPGFDADFLLVHPNNPLPSSIASVYIQGKEVAKYS
ncbi:MAG: alpha-D-ribose 1-methylphosphonate 5-triphosphate diphosphatase [Nostocales cyanobacterium 94392]|nr:alpha-D-ribose 1-methylphosphonate 5-triphosphate diphosphatase [Nostocales cyanobacterium 94392]